MTPRSRHPATVRTSRAPATLHPPRQARSRETLERILSAAETMIEERSFDDATVPQIVSRAETSVGSFYARFENKESLLATLLHRYHERMIEVAAEELDEARWTGTDLETRARGYVRFVVVQCRAARGVLRERLLRNVTRPERVPAEQEAIIERYVSLLRAFFAPALPEIRHPAPEEALDFALQLLDSYVGTNVLLANETLAHFRPLDEERMIGELTRAFLRYLGAPGT